MEYRFSVTARLVAVGVFCLVALLVLLFAFGVAVGDRLASAKPRTASAPGAEIVTETVIVPVEEGAEK